MLDFVFWCAWENLGAVSSYLSGRSQRILFDGIKSDSFDVRFGVPQGSCLGPLLFAMYIAKLFEIVQAHLPDAHCFADTQLYLSFNHNNPNHQMDAVSAMERCICDLRKWMYQDKLKINDDKTEQWRSKLNNWGGGGTYSYIRVLHS